MAREAVAELFDDIKYCLDVSNEYKEKGQEIEWTHFLGSFVFERSGKRSNRD